MTEEPTTHQQVTPDDLVEKTLERAAERVAKSATDSVPSGSSLTRMEALAILGVLIILNLACLVVDLSTRSQTIQHRRDFKAVCQLIVDTAPPGQDPKALAAKFAECLH